MTLSNTKMYQLLEEAISKVKNIHLKSAKEVDGEIFTHIRTELAHIKQDGTIYISNPTGYNMRNARFFFSDLHNNLEMRTVYNDLIKKAVEEGKGGMSDLGIALMGIQSCIAKMKRVSDESEKVCSRLTEVDEILGKEEE